MSIWKSLGCFYFALSCTAIATPSLAAQVSEHWDIGGALRARLDRDPDRHINKFGFDTLMLGAKYQSDDWVAAARYRYYGKAFPFQYTGLGGVAFTEYAWVGYRFDTERELQVGLNPVPFGLLPLYSSSFYETLGNVIGLEDVSEMGIKYAQSDKRWEWQLGYYLKPAWPGKGKSRGSTYAIVVTPADDGVEDGSRNHQRDTLAARLLRKYEHGSWQGNAGVSLYNASLYNLDTGGRGWRRAYALHAQAQHGPWSLKFQFARQVMSPRNPGARDVVTFGGYDGTFNVAGRGNIYVADISYTIPDSYAGGWIHTVRPYITYSRFDKSTVGYATSQRLLFGTSFSLKALYVAVEWMHGRNDPYIGGSSYTQSLAQGGIDRWKSQFYINVGYYF